MNPKEVSEGDILEFDIHAKMNESLPLSYRKELNERIGLVKFLSFSSNDVTDSATFTYKKIKTGRIGGGWFIGRFKKVLNYQAKIAKKFKI